MSWTVAMDQGQLNDVRSLLANIPKGYNRAVMRAANYAADRTKTAVSKKLKALITADPYYIDKSLRKVRAVIADPEARLVVNPSGDSIPLFRFDVSFMFPTVSGGVTANIFKDGVQPLHLRHAFVAKMRSGHVGVFERSGPKVKMGGGSNYAGQYKQPIKEAFGPHPARVFERTPGVEKELLDIAADRFASELMRQAELLYKQEFGADPPEDWAN